MQIILKNYNILKTKQYIKYSNLFFFFNGIDQNSKDLLETKQKLKNINFNYYTIFNKTSTKIVKNSIYQNFRKIISGGTFLIKSIKNEPLTKKILFNNFENLIFVFLASKINNKIYSSDQLKTLDTLNYYKNKLLLYQFLIIKLKSKYFMLI